MAKTIKVDTPGYYYFDGEVWQRFYTSKNIDTWFYMPSFNLDMSSLGVKSVNLYDKYKEQFENPETNPPTVPSNNTYFKSNNPSIKFVGSKIYVADELDYIVTFFDENYIEIISIDNQGNMEYEVKNMNPPSHSFINIILQPKK